MFALKHCDCSLYFGICTAHIFIRIGHITLTVKANSNKQAAGKKLFFSFLLSFFLAITGNSNGKKGQSPVSLLHNISACFEFQSVW